MRLDVFLHDDDNEEELRLLKEIKTLLEKILAALQPQSNVPTGGTVTLSNIREQ